MNKGPSFNGSLKASILPLILAIGTVLVGAALLVTVTAAGGTTGVLGISFLGYFLSGFATPLLWGWDAAAQRRGYVNPNFQGKRGYSSFLRVLALAGIGISIIHLVFASTVVAEKISEWLFINQLLGV